MRASQGVGCRLAVVAEEHPQWPEGGMGRSRQRHVAKMSWVRRENETSAVGCGKGISVYSAVEAVPGQTRRSARETRKGNTGGIADGGRKRRFKIDGLIGSKG